MSLDVQKGNQREALRRKREERRARSSAKKEAAAAAAATAGGSVDNAEAAALQLAVEDALAVEEMALAADRKVRSKLSG